MRLYIAGTEEKTQVCCLVWAAFVFYMLLTVIAA